MSINNVSKNQLVYNLLKKSMDASSLTKEVIANNIANFNTKGYKRYYVTFEDTLKKNEDELALKTTEDRHIEPGGKFADIDIEQDKYTSLREDGNNVDVENEMVNQAANSLMYNALTGMVNSRLASARYVINEGRR